MKVVVANTKPIISLAAMGQLDILCNLFCKIIISFLDYASPNL
jgi:predicted nucleic acid-binding protein